MHDYKSTIIGHNIARAQEIGTNGSLEHAKRVASREFGDGFDGHKIIIQRRVADPGGWSYETIAERTLPSRYWSQY